MSGALIVGIVVFAVGILASVALHEVGHLVPAKVFGVHVSQYMVGFGPTLVSTRRGETEYGLKAIPLGGYVRLTGMYPPAPQGRRPRRSAPWRALIDDARAAALRDVPPEARGRTFYSRRPWQKLIVMAGGPAMNLLLGLLLFGVALSVIGSPTVQASPVISAVAPCVHQDASGTCPAGDPRSPAAVAGLRAGDRIEAVGAAPVRDWSDAQRLLRESPPRTTVTVDRGGRTVRLPVRLARVPDPRADGGTVGFLGVSPSEVRVVTRREGPGAATGAWWGTVTGTARAVVTLPQRLVAIVVDTATGRPRSSSDPVGIVGATRVGGDVAAAAQPVAVRVSTFLELLASVNVALAVFNLLPLLPLDGGHLLGALWEGLRRSLARLRRRPDPGFVDVARAIPLAYAVGAVLVTASLLLVYADVVNPVRLG